MKSIIGLAIFVIFLATLFLVLLNRDVSLETEEHLYQGYGYDKIGNFEQALREFNEAIRLDPRHARAYSHRGRTYYNLGQHQRAAQDFDRSITLDPQDSQAYIDRGYLFLNQGQLREAIDDFDSAISVNDNLAQAYANRALGYSLLGNDVHAEEAIARAVGLGMVREELEAMIEEAKRQR